LAYDIFGRERHRTDREDMGGTGSFSRFLFIHDWIFYFLANSFDAERIRLYILEILRKAKAILRN